MNTGRDWIRWRCCVPYGRHSRRWSRCPRLSPRKLLTVKALTGFWPGCPARGNREKPGPPARREHARLATGGPGRVLRRRLVRRAVVAAEGPRHQRQGSAGTASVSPSRAVQRHPAADPAARGEGLARRHGQEAGLRCFRRACSGTASQGRLSPGRNRNQRPIFR